MDNQIGWDVLAAMGTEAWADVWQVGYSSVPDYADYPTRLSVASVVDPKIRIDIIGAGLLIDAG